MPRSAWKGVAAILSAVLAVVLWSCGGGSGGSSSTSSSERPAGPEITLSATTHRPVAGAPWPIAIRAYDADGRPLRAEVRYQYLLGDTVVARRSHYRFRGAFHDTFRWPARSLNVPLTFRAVVTTPEGKRNLDYDVRVRR